MISIIRVKTTGGGRLRPIPRAPLSWVVREDSRPAFEIDVVSAVAGGCPWPAGRPGSGLLPGAGDLLIARAVGEQVENLVFPGRQVVVP